MNKTNASGMGKYKIILGVLLVVLIALELLHVINWSWLWVLAPAWVPVACLALVIFLIFLVSRFQRNR
ncbi:MAG TPA: hypothetical protein VHT73_02855 [Thermodesulfobacteriota bacterium]|nr:hypothetical protein [Thermodesulfobacteriota bacterium]